MAVVARAVRSGEIRREQARAWESTGMRERGGSREARHLARVVHCVNAGEAVRMGCDVVHVSCASDGRCVCSLVILVVIMCVCSAF